MEFIPPSLVKFQYGNFYIENELLLVDSNRNIGATTRSQKDVQWTAQMIELPSMPIAIFRFIPVWPMSTSPVSIEGYQYQYSRIKLAHAQIILIYILRVPVRISA
jgi:hypothetical protein